MKTLRFSVKDARIADLSVSGARVEAKVEARLLSRIQIAIVLPLWPGHASPFIEAYVARKYDSGFGIEWCEFAPRAISELLRGGGIARSDALRQRLVAYRPTQPVAASFFNSPAPGKEAFTKPRQVSGLSEVSVLSAI
jgi:hypothetical protein